MRQSIIVLIEHELKGKHCEECAGGVNAECRRKKAFMFETLDEQIKHTGSDPVPTSTTAFRYAGIAVITLVIFCAFFMAIMLLEY